MSAAFNGASPKETQGNKAEQPENHPFSRNLECSCYSFVLSCPPQSCSWFLVKDERWEKKKKPTMMSRSHGIECTMKITASWTEVSHVLFCIDGSAAYKLRIFHMCREMKSKRMGRCSPNPPIYLNSKSGLQFPIVVLREPISCRAQIKQSNSRVVWGHDGRLRDCRTLTERAVEMSAEPSEGALVIDQALQHHHEAPCTLAQRAVGVLLQEVEELLSYLGQHCRHVVSGDWISMIQVHHSIF